VRFSRLTPTSEFLYNSFDGAEIQPEIIQMTKNIDITKFSGGKTSFHSGYIYLFKSQNIASILDLYLIAGYNFTHRADRGLVCSGVDTASSKIGSCGREPILDVTSLSILARWHYIGRKHTTS
jgi:hypothetical protein